MLRNTISKSLLGSFINEIKKGNTNDHCALSLLLNLPDACIGDAISDEFWQEDCDKLVYTYESRKDWNDVIKFALQK